MSSDLSQLLCANCEYWKVDGFCKEFKFGNRMGKCSELFGEIEIALRTGHDGGYVESITTDDTFGCNLFKKRST